MQEIDIHEARRIAVGLATDSLKYAMEDNDFPILDDFFIKEDFCWIFFRDERITLLAEANLSDWAFAVTIYGNCRYIYNLLSYDIKEGYDYAKKLSDRLCLDHENGMY